MRIVYAGTLRGETCRFATTARAAPSKAGLPRGQGGSHHQAQAVADGVGRKRLRHSARKDADDVGGSASERLGMADTDTTYVQCAADWSKRQQAPPGTVQPTGLEKKRIYGVTIAETFAYRTVKDGKKITRPAGLWAATPGSEHVNGAILADHRRVDPFQADWLESIPASWDGTKRLVNIGCLLTRVKGPLTDNPLTRWASYYHCALGADPANAYEPGCKLR